MSSKIKHTQVRRPSKEIRDDNRDFKIKNFSKGRKKNPKLNKNEEW